MVRLVTRWSDRCRRVRFAHLQRPTVPVILGRDFLAKAAIVLDFSKGGYRKNSFGPLKPFASAPPVKTTRVDGGGVGAEGVTTKMQKLVGACAIQTYVRATDVPHR